MGPCVISHGMTYILVEVDYMYKLVEDISFPNNKEKCVTAFWKKNIFSKVSTHRAIISDSVSHFCNKLFNCVLEKYGLLHNVAIPNHPQTRR